jgi:uncharacterized protein (DUF2147 family)
VKAIVGAALAVWLLLVPAHADEGVLGRWATPGVAAIVELAPCPGASTLCGTVRWLWDAVDERGRPRLDVENVDGSLRARPLLGLPILSGLVPRGGGGWSGQIYNPEDGKTYNATLRRAGPDSLMVEGCVLFICQKQVWRRASTLAEALR